MGNAKIKKIKTWPLSKIIIDQGHVLGNTNFSSGKQICVFTLIQCFFLRLKMTIVFFQISSMNTNKKSQLRHVWREMAFMWSEKGVMRSWRCREAYSENNRPFVALLQKISKSLCQIHFGLLLQISGLKMCHWSIWIIRGYCWDPQMKAKPEKKIWGPLLW